MKNLSIILNIVLLVAVGVLYFLHFSGGHKSTSDGGSSTAADLGELKIAYINSDSVLEQYDYLKAAKVQMENKSKQFDQDLTNRAAGLENEIRAYQRNVNSMTLGQARATEEDLTKKQQNLQLYRQSLGQQLMEEEAKLNQELNEKVRAFLDRYAKEKGYHVILKYDVASDVMQINPALDISKDVVKGLNDAFKTDKTGAADSTKTK